MLIYFILFIFPAILALSKYNSKSASNSGIWFNTFVAYSLVIGLRHEVGGDWSNDWNDFNYRLSLMTESSLINALKIGDPAYSLIMWIIYKLNLGVHTLDFISSLIFTYGLIDFCKKQTRPWLVLTIAVPYLVIVIAMGYVRQSVAIGLALISISSLLQGRLLKFLIIISISATFHKSALIMIPLALFTAAHSKLITIIVAFLFLITSYYLLLNESVELIYSNYILYQYDSEGAFIRIIMNALPSLLFLIYRNKFELKENELIFWTWMSLIGILFVVILKISPASTIIDRLALYWIPIQLFVFSRLPDALSSNYPQKKFLLVLGIVLYSFFVLVVWLFFANTAFAWLPYKFYFLELIY